MRILDDEESRAMSSVTLYLTPSEALQLNSYLEQLLDDPVRWHHAHLNDENYEREITVTVYVPENLDQYDARSRRLILEGD